MTDRLKRIMTDLAGYALILLGVLSGWLPGPGGIPLILAGLGLLSINNMWAERWRNWLVAHGGDFVNWFFPKHRIVQAFYDVAAVVLIVLVAFLIWRRAAIWQISLAVSLFFLAMMIVGFNRDRAVALKSKIKKKKSK